MFADLPRLPAPLGTLFHTAALFRRLPTGDRLSAAGLVGPMLEFDADDDTYARWGLCVYVVCAVCAVCVGCGFVLDLCTGVCGARLVGPMLEVDANEETYAGVWVVGVCVFECD